MDLVDYNNAKAFVDMSDQMAAYSNYLRRSVKWYRKLAFEFITGTSVVNALYFYNKINDKKISVTTFKENLAMQIFKSINPPNTSDTSIEHRLTEKTDQDNKPKRGRSYFQFAEMACSRGQKILSLLQNTADTSEGMYLNEATKKSDYKYIILLAQHISIIFYITTQNNKKDYNKSLLEKYR
nr:unnamed protein product [Callosobruchus chinensis]